MAETFSRMRQMVGSADDWATNDLVLGFGEIAIQIEDNVPSMKVGDGVKKFSALPWLAQNLWSLSGSAVFSTVDGPVVVGRGLAGAPDQLTVRGGNQAVGAYRESIPLAGEHLGKVKLGALDDTSTLANGAEIRAEAAGDWSPTNNGARLRFVVTPEGTVTDVSVMVIEDDGGVVVGSPAGGSMGAGTINVEALYINGVLFTP